MKRLVPLLILLLYPAIAQGANSVSWRYDGTWQPLVVVSPPTIANLTGNSYHQETPQGLVEMVRLEDVVRLFASKDGAKP